MSLPFNSTYLGQSLHFPKLVALARECPHRNLQHSDDVNRPGFQICSHEYDHGSEVGISGRVLCEPSSRDARIYWITISGRVTLQDFCQKIREWTEDVPDENVMVHCSQEGFMHFHYDHS